MISGEPPEHRSPAEAGGAAAAVAEEVADEVAD